MLLLIPLLAWSLSSHPRTTPRPVPALDSPTRHVRTTDPHFRALLEDGYRRSPTLASLVDRLDKSNVVVYIQPAPALRGPVDARLTIVPSGGRTRYVRIMITVEHSPDDLIALLGHELRHAVEVADAPAVFDDAGMNELYACIGTRWGDHEYETQDALDAARRVRKELSSVSSRVF